MKRTQEDMVLEHLKRHGAITADVALREYSIRQLPARIFHLRERGVAIRTVDRTGLNTFGNRVRYAEYRLAS